MWPIESQTSTWVRDTLGISFYRLLFLCLLIIQYDILDLLSRTIIELYIDMLLHKDSSFRCFLFL